jgi:hypothetical protein
VGAVRAPDTEVLMSTEAEAAHSGEAGKSVTIEVVNEDTGKEYKLHGGPGTPLSTVITELYDAKLKTQRKGDDRLRCESSGEDVFGYADQGMTLGQYFEAGHCPDQVWLFAAGTGGAC